MIYSHQSNLVFARRFCLSDGSTVRATLMRRCRDRPMAFADACLVRMAELHSDASVWTLDEDFRFYRKNRRQTLSLIIPE
jgi:predicted nucleic acid-binding protein